MASSEQWRLGYARQAQADYQTYEFLQEYGGLPRCQSLHFLQMACEKLCKAYLCDQGADPQELRRSHGVIARTLPNIARQQLARESKQNAREKSWLIDSIRKMAREIELLIPSMDDGGRSPSNCEYPWENSQGSVVAPIDYPFSFSLATNAGGRQLLRIIRAALEDSLRDIS